MPISPPPRDIFRAYDIRGVAGRDLTVGNIRLIGQAIAESALARGRQTLLFGADARLSSPELAPALREGLMASGCDLVDLGLVPTPLLYFAAHTTEHDSGVMLTASHNPADYNGIKVVLHGRSLTPGQIQALYERSLTLASTETGGNPAKAGHRTRQDVVPAYIRHLKKAIVLQRPLHVVVDCGNAIAGLIAPPVLEAIGCRVTPLFCEVDGRFPNHHPDPTINSNLCALRRTVVEQGADLGIALDGDGDRMVVVSNSGRIVDTDRLLMLLVRDILPRHPGANVVFDVKCSSLLREVIEEAGGQAVLCRSGHSFMKSKMQETDAVVGAEFSAHVFIRDGWFGHDDGLYVAARFMELLARGPEDVDALLDSLPQAISTEELRVEVDEGLKFLLMEKIADQAHFPEARINRLDGLRAEFLHGWGLIRASNTTPALLLRFEADDDNALQRIQDSFRKLLQQAAPGLDVPF
ncbi:MAG: phosphomannomutase/phosphoglucomutase [Pseudohongiellaceae bacterium]